MMIAFPLLLDGPTGTELQRREFEIHLPLWSARALIEAPEVVEAIHTEYIKAGAHLITTNSFRTNKRTIERAGYSAEKAEELTRQSVVIAQKARSCAEQPDVLIAGSDAPVEDCYSPDLVPTHDELYREHEEHIKWLAESGADLILIETMNTLREACIASKAAVKFNLPFIVSVVTDPSGRQMLSGELLEVAVAEVSQFNPLAILTNCSAPRAVLHATEILAELHRTTNASWKFGGYPNSGEPDPILGWNFVHTVPVDQFVETAGEMINAGAQVIGSCCGTTPGYTKALRGLIDSVQVRSGE